MDISLGIIAFNEEKNIINLLNSIDRQKTGDFRIKEIILVLGGCKDNTYERSKSYNGKYKNVLKILVFNERRGKYCDINVFLKKHLLKYCSFKRRHNAWQVLHKKYYCTF